MASDLWAVIGMLIGMFVGAYLMQRAMKNAGWMPPVKNGKGIGGKG